MRNRNIVINKSTDITYGNMKRLYPQFDKPGVYFREGDNGKIKIGKSKKMLKRMFGAKTDICEDTITVIGYIRCKEHEIDSEEQKAFRHFGKYHSKEEWYYKIPRQEINDYILSRNSEILEEEIKIAKRAATKITKFTDDFDGVEQVGINQVRPRCFFYSELPAHIVNSAGESEDYRTYSAKELGLFDLYTAEALRSHPSVKHSRGQLRVYVCYRKHLEIMASNRAKKEPLGTLEVCMS